MGTGNLINREVELCDIHQSLHAPTGTTILVIGPGGVGKTTVINEELAQHPELRVLRVAPDASSQLSDHALNLLASALGCLPAYTAATSESDQVRVLFTALDDQPPGSHRTVLLFEDSQWLDPASERVLWGLLRVLHQLNVTAILARNPDDAWLTTNVVRLINAEAQSRVVELSPLDQQQVTHYVEQSLGVELPARSARAVARATGGIPLYLEAMVGLVRSGRVRSLAEAVETVTERASRDLLLADLVDQQIGSADAATQTALLAISLAEGLSLADLAATLRKLDLPPLSRSGLLRTTLVELDPARLFQIRHAAIARMVIDATDLDQQLQLRAILAEVLPANRALAQRVAIGIVRPDPELNAELARAAAAAAAAGDLDESIRLRAALVRVDPSTAAEFAIACLYVGREDALASALAHLDDRVCPITAHLLQAFVAYRQRDYDQAAIQLRALLDQPMGLTESLLLSYLAITVGGASILVGEFARLSLVHLVLDRLGVVLAEHAGDPSQAEQVQWGVGLTWVARPILVWENFLSPGYGFLEALADLEGFQVELEQLPGSESFRSSVLMLRAELLRQSGQSERAAEIFTQMQQQGMPDLQVNLTAVLTMSWVNFEAGRWDQAHREASRFYGRTLGIRDDGSSVELTVLATLVPLVRGETELALQRLRLAEQLMPPQERSLAKVHLRLARVWANVVRGGDPVEVANELSHIWGTLNYGGVADHSTLILLLRAALEVDRPEDVALVIRELDDPRWPRTPRTDYVRAHCLALLAGREADLDRALALFDGAATALAHQRETEPHSEMRIFASILAEDQARHLLRRRGAGAKLDAALIEGSVAQLRLAARRSAGLGQGHWAARLEGLAEEVDHGRTAVHRIPAPPRPIVPGGPESQTARGITGSAVEYAPQAAAVRPTSSPATDQLWEVAAGLTSREREITELVVEGRTNKEIAGDLFLSVRTVEYHVGNVLAKLNCRSRVELRTLVKSMGGLTAGWGSPTSASSRPFTAVPRPARSQQADPDSVR